MKVWDRAGMELATPGSAVRHASVARHVTDWATRPGPNCLERLSADHKNRRLHRKALHIALYLLLAGCFSGKKRYR